jgi:hypothetical protein
VNRYLVCLVLLLGGCATGRDPAIPSSPVAPETTPAAASGPVASPSKPAEPTPSSPSEVVESAPPAAPDRPLTYSELATANDERLLDVVPGMTRAEVDRIMDLRRDGRPLNPARQEVLRDRDGRTYLVLFYLTREPMAGRPVRENLMTPVIFQNDKVVGIGRYPLKKLRKVACFSTISGQNCGSPKP